MRQVFQRLARLAACPVAACAVVAAASGVSAAESPIGFTHAGDFDAASHSSGLGAGAVSSADFDRDGFADLVVSNCGATEPTVFVNREDGGGPTVLLGNGDGTFGAPTVIRSDYDACAVGAGDLNADGNPDVLAGSYFSGDVTVLLGNGDGTFTKGERYHTGGNPQQFAIADFDRDGRVDFASTNNVPGTLTMVLGNGDGTFRPLDAVAVGYETISIVAGDFDRDGVLDLAITDVVPQRLLGVPQADRPLPGEVEVLLGNGDGTFQPQTTYLVGFAPEYVDTGDLDNDGYLDLVVGNAIYDNDVSVLYGLGDGTFAPEQRVTPPGGGTWTSGAAPDGDPGVRVADFDRDGNLDFAVIQSVASEVLIMRGDGRRQFTPAGAYPTANFPEGFLAADLTGDGYDDLAIPGNLPLAKPVPPTTKVSVYVNRSGTAALR